MAVCSSTSDSEASCGALSDALQYCGAGDGKRVRPRPMTRARSIHIHQFEVSGHEEEAVEAGGTLGSLALSPPPPHAQPSASELLFVSSNQSLEPATHLLPTHLTRALFVLFQSKKHAAASTEDLLYPTDYHQPALDSSAQWFTGGGDDSGSAGGVYSTATHHLSDTDMPPQATSSFSASSSCHPNFFIGRRPSISAMTVLRGGSGINRLKRRRRVPFLGERFLASVGDSRFSVPPSNANQPHLT